LRPRSLQERSLLANSAETLAKLAYGLFEAGAQVVLEIRFLSGEKVMWTSKSEGLIVEKTGEAFPELYLVGM